MSRKRHNHRRKLAEEPYWEPLPRQTFSATATTLIVARHVVPLVAMLLFGGSVVQFLLLTLFNIAFAVACIGTIGLAVSTRGVRTNAADRILSWVFLLIINVIVSFVLTTLFGWVIALIASFEPDGLWNATLGWSVLAIMLCAVPGLYLQYKDDLRAGLTEDQLKRRDQPQVLTHVLCIGLMFILSGQVADMGQGGLIAMALAVTALFIFRDLRPDLMRELMQPKYRAP